MSELLNLVLFLLLYVFIDLLITNQRFKFLSSIILVYYTNVM